jgi:aldehyde:ferredoxin oxidoreductase
MDLLLQVNEYLNRVGMDSISVGTTEGIGANLADGTYQASQHFPGTESFAINANGAEISMHDLCLTKSWGMSFVADPTPGRHTTSNYDKGQLGTPDFFPSLKPKIEKTIDSYRQGKVSVWSVKLHQVMESLGLCMISYFFSDYRYNLSKRGS